MDKPDTSKALCEYKARFITEGERMAKDILPAKFVELDNIYHEIKNLKLSKTNTERKELNIERVLINSLGNNSTRSNFSSRLHASAINENAITSNQILLEVIEKLKPHIDDLVGSSCEIKMWITLLIPRIQDGNNFGVSVQEAVMEEASTIEMKAKSLKESGTDYFFFRAKMISKIIKYPEITDYKMAVMEFDSNELQNQINLCRDMRNMYAKLHDLVIKNLHKIQNPRSDHAGDLY
ncbi:proteasome activator complex subunit 3-like [Saccostrea echinata]|uniref:proteasome activator complex subunit 3-like n=1 Tax=Saccostrea echinata TaxID=191078 RepID=UPI002A7F0E0D|nr:proteasome activator complex subunit 3-like [Saccostrea echinata]